MKVLQKAIGTESWTAGIFFFLESASFRASCHNQQSYIFLTRLGVSPEPNS